MGNNQSLTFIQELYSFVQNYHDQKLGQSKIYKNKFHPNQYVIQYTLNIPHDQVQHIEKNIKAFQHILLSQNEPHPFLKIVHYAFSNQTSGLGNQLTKTCKIPQIVIWVEFLRHNLKQFLNWRISQNRPLCLEQVKMTIEKATKAYFLSKKKEYFGVNLNLEDVSISIDGQVKFNPLLSKKIQSLSSSFVSAKGDNALKNRILQKRSYNHFQQNSPNRIINLNSRKELNFQTFQQTQDTKFLYQLKKFANKLILQCGYKHQNPQESYLSENKDIKIFLDWINRSSSLKDIIQMIGKPSIQRLMVDFSKQKHQESQSRFSKILSQLQQKSQRTDYSAYTSPIKKKSVGNLPITGYSLLNLTQHYYY